MESKGYTEELLAEESWVSLSTIKQYRQKEDKVKTLKTVIAICIGLHLHPWITEDLIRKAGLTIKATRMDGAYRYLYTFHYDKQTRTWFEVTPEQFEEYDRWRTRIRKREQYHRRCMCPRSKWWLCDGMCQDCEFHTPGDTISLDAPVANKDGDAAKVMFSFVRKTTEAF